MGTFEITHHDFTQTILKILKGHFGEVASDIFSNSSILGYLNIKTKSANQGSKARGSFANHYALYVIVEDYIQKGFLDGTADTAYAQYEGAKFSDLSRRQRELPFGAKLQNHALNSRLNDEFKKLYPNTGKLPIVRSVETQRYWIQEDLLLVTIRDRRGQDHTYNIAQTVIDIIDKYAQTKLAALEKFLEICRKFAELKNQNSQNVTDFIIEQLAPNVDARIFEIVSYAILKIKYRQNTIWIGKTKEDIAKKSLILYKTGRTNANDGGIDFVMRPLGRFFQVTETVNTNKYFLDIDKIQKFPITFVVKSTQSIERIRKEIRDNATEKYKIQAVVEMYMKAVEEIINVNDLINAFNEIVKSGELESVMEEIILHSELEFNYLNQSSPT